MGMVLGAIALLATLAVGVLLNGWVLTVLWAWFVVPAFHVRPLPLALAIGLSLLVTHVVPAAYRPEQEWQEAVGSFLGSAFGKALLILFIGWIVHQWV